MVPRSVSTSDIRLLIVIAFLIEVTRRFDGLQYCVQRTVQVEPTVPILLVDCCRRRRSCLSYNTILYITAQRPVGSTGRRFNGSDLLTHSTAAVDSTALTQKSVSFLKLIVDLVTSVHAVAAVDSTVPRHYLQVF